MMTDCDDSRGGTGLPKLTILGGGPAGLAVAYYAKKAGLTYSVLEAAEDVGGNCRTLEFAGHRFDTGAHRLHNERPRVTAEIRSLLGDDLLTVEAPSRICIDGKLLDFPISPLNLLRTLDFPTVACIVRDKFKTLGRSAADASNFADFATTRYGKALAQMLLLGYTAKLWGADPAKLSTRVAGGRLKGLDLRTFVLEMVRGTGGKRRHLDGTFYYPRNGYGSIMDAVAAAVGRQHIHCRAHVNGLRHDGSRITHVAVEGSAPQPVEQLVSTLPLTVAVRALQPAAPKAILDLAAGLRFRHLRLAVFVLHKPSFSPNASLYFPDPADPYTRIYEPKNRSRALSPAEETTIVVEIPCSSTDDVWLDDDRKILERICSSLARKNLLLPSDVRAGCTVRLRNAYPILEVGFEDRAGALGEFLESFDNLSLAGRSARFEYTHVHEIFAAAEALVEDLGACASNPLALPSSSECGSESLAA